MQSLRFVVAGLLATLISCAAFAGACDGFTDVDDANATYCSAVSYLKTKGITLGCTGTTYCPNDYVTRLQMALFLQRMSYGGADNVVGAFSNTIGGGGGNTTKSNVGFDNVIGGGRTNTATGGDSTVGGGLENQATGLGATVAGGYSNVASGGFATIAGGSGNSASGNFATVSGKGNVADGSLSVVLGYRGTTTAVGGGSFVFSDSTEAPGGALYGSGLQNIFIAGATNGFYLYTNKDTSTGCTIAPGGGTWSCTSSKDVKRDFSDVDRDDVLERVAALPMQRWRYKNESPEIRHMGTFAQDFHSAFGLGSDDRTISMADAEGVALAAIQALHARVAELTHRLAAVEAMLNTR